MQKITILGGGASGWLTASYLKAYFSREGRLPVDITLVESEDIGTVGVGEATIPSITETLRFLGVDELDFMRATQATFKNSICFENWSRKGDPEDYFHHPFFAHGEIKLVKGIATWLLTSSLCSKPYHYAALTNPQYVLSGQAKAPKEFPGDDFNSSYYSYAYHMDATLFGQYLRNYAMSRGVSRIEGKVVDVERTADGGISQLLLQCGQKVAADLFVDCSG